MDGTGMETLSDAIRKSGVAASRWKLLPVRDRVRAFPMISRYITAHADEIASEITSATGKTLTDALAAEVIPAAVAADYYFRHAARILKPRVLSGGGIFFFNKRAVLEYVPAGVVGIISPWNYPFSIPFHEVLMALAAGNGVILKVASNCTVAGERIRTIISEAGFPDGLFSLIHMKGSEAGPAFIDAGVNKLFFTGSVPVGKALMKKAAERLVPVCLELGGKDAMIVLEDADVDRASSGAVWGGIANCGQSCAGVERIYVFDAVYDRFTQALRRKVAALRQGRGDSPDSDFGPLTTGGQYETVKLHVADALEKGAVVTASSVHSHEEGNYYPALVVENVNESMLLMTEETFGPVLAVDRVLSIEEAVRKANSGKFGLTASVWTRDRKQGLRVASLLEAGTVTINDHLMTHGMPQTPWGGFRESGIGRTHGPLGLYEMTQPRVTVEEKLPWLKKNIFWHPYSAHVYTKLKGALEFLYGKRILRRILGGLGIIAMFIKAARPDNRNRRTPDSKD